MHRYLVGVACFLLGAASIQAQTSPGSLTAKIDGHLAQRMRAAKVNPAARADDAEFLRRVYLDVAGRIPSVAEARDFLADKREDRRARLVEQLLASPRYASHFAAVYRALLIPEAGNNFLVRFQQGGFEDWLRHQLSSGQGFDQLTRNLLTAPLNQNAVFALNSGVSPQAFYAAKEFKPESLAAGTARVFLGVRVECAQCHNHPFADWKREQFWALAAFFSGIQAQQAGDVVYPGQDQPNKRELKIPGTDTYVQARFLDGQEPKWTGGGTTRAVLADWIVAPTNPYFARATVNRTWAYFFGAGLVEPIDEMVGTGSTASHPELLDLLAREFAAQKYDLKFLIRAITLTEAYQRTSAGKDPRQGEPAHFARMPLRGLTPEQLFDSLVMATGYRDATQGKENLLDALSGKPSARAQLLAKFANQTERATMAQTSIIQALMLMNGTLTADATSLKRSETLAAVLDAPFLDTPQRIETLYLATLSRLPTPRERDRAAAFVGRATRGVDADKTSRAWTTAYGNAFADVFWALLNSSEFSLNH